jgi:hypothetical protein
MADEDAKMRRPAFENKVNLNTILLAIALLGAGVGWGVTLTTARKDIDQNALAIATNKADIDALQADMRSTMQTQSNLQYRTTALEAGLASANAKQGETDKAMNQVVSDVRVIKEIVQRMDPRGRDR